MAEYEKVTLTNMCMVTDGEGRVLVQDRLDPNWPGIVFPGGHVEPGESFAASVKREVWEETGLTIEDPRLCGVKQFWTKEGIRYVVMLYRATRFSGELRGSEEGNVFWLERSALNGARLVPTLESMLRVFEGDEFCECCWPKDGDEVVLL